MLSFTGNQLNTKFISSFFKKAYLSGLVTNYRPSILPDIILNPSFLPYKNEIRNFGFQIKAVIFSYFRKGLFFVKKYYLIQ
ncbi:hypothetical protein J5TS2_08960 [Brevibacillus halotolerans]|nr:hypothetical protein J5TS2_08960 [Brevibacillus halotolerans]